MSPRHIMPDEWLATRAAAAEDVRRSFSMIGCTAALLAKRTATHRERQLLAAILQSVARGEAALVRLGGPAD